MKSAEHTESFKACYYCLTALLYTKEVYTKTHAGTKAQFFELFIKTGIFSVEVSDTMSLLFNSRQAADYNPDADITEKNADILIASVMRYLFLR